MGANTNPPLEDGFCTTGTKEDITESLQLVGVTPENPMINGYVINKIFNMIFENLNHQKKKGFAFWQPDSHYEATENNIDICRRNNKIFFCKQTHNKTGEEPKLPENNPDYWTVLYDLNNPPALGNHIHSDYLRNETGSSINTSPNTLYKGVALFLHKDCPTNTDNWYIIAVNYSMSEYAASMQIAVSYSSTIPKMYIRTKHYSKTTWESWTQIDNSNSASLNHNHKDTYLGILDTAVDSSKLGNLHPNYYLGLNQGTNSQDPNTTLFENILTNHINTPDSSEYWYITTKFYGAINNSSSQMQIAVQYANGNKVFVRNKYLSNAWGKWREIGKQIKRLAYDGSAIEGQYGFSSVVRNTKGIYTCYFSTPMPNTNYSVVTSVLGDDFVIGHTKTTNYVAINRLHSSDNVYYDGGFSLAILED